MSPPELPGDADDWADEEPDDRSSRTRRPPSWRDAGIAPPERTCWRCDKTAVPNQGRCPYCRARVETALEERIFLPAARGVDPVMKVIWIFIGLVVVSLVQGLVFKTKGQDWLLEGTWETRVLTAVAAFEAIDTCLVALGFCWIGRLGGLAKPEDSWRLIAWLWALPGLALLLGVNYGYHLLLNEYLRQPMQTRWPFTPLTFLLVCIQPAIVEEFFFRYLAMNALRRYVGLHGTVWVVSAMFGLAHIGQPVGIPVLILAGVFLGYARILSGGLLLPMLLHLAHNTVFLYLETVV